MIRGHHGLFLSTPKAAKGAFVGFAVRRRLEDRVPAYAGKDQDRGGEIRLRSAPADRPFRRGAARSRRPSFDREHRPRPCLLLHGGRRLRNGGSMSSVTSLASGSRLTTQVWPAVAETRPATCKPTRPWRVTSKLASKRGRSRKPAMRATAARVSASAARSKCCPSSGTSSSATGTCHGKGALFSRSGIHESLRAWKDGPARDQEIFRLGVQLRSRRTHITRKRRRFLPRIRPT